VQIETAATHSLYQQNASMPDPAAVAGRRCKVQLAEPSPRVTGAQPPPTKHQLSHQDFLTAFISHNGGDEYGNVDLGFCATVLIVVDFRIFTGNGTYTHSPFRFTAPLVR
jgi:hypothetical protein